MSWLFYFKALLDGDVSRIAPMDKLSVAITIRLVFVFLREPVDIKTIAGGLMITVGLVLLLL